MLNPKVIQQQIVVCKECSLCEGRSSGYRYVEDVYENSDVLFVTLEPDSSIQDIADDVADDLFLQVSYISVFKCPLTMTVASEHFIICSQYFKEQLKLIKPKILIIFGEDTLKYLTIKEIDGVLSETVLNTHKIYKNTYGFRYNFGKGVCKLFYAPSDARFNLENLKEFIRNEH